MPVDESADDIKQEILTAMREDPEIRKEMRAEVLRVAQQGAAYARSIAPVGGATGPDPFAGTFRDSIHAEEITTGRAGKLPAARIISEDPAAVAIEYGTSRTPEHHTFADTEIAMKGEGTDTTKPYWTSQTDVDPSLRKR
jgi:hypothetical protein